ncbi:MAG: aquaporin [Thaumarchaeota archaeon]|nr:aquaporin [Nitrososphaerota archaeon]
MPTPSLTRQCLSELLGTYLLVSLGPGSVIATSALGIAPLESLLIIATAFGCAVGGIIILLGRFSGAHINPAISVASATAGVFKRNLLLPYVLFQLTGAILAGLSLRIVFGNLGASTSLGSTTLAAGVPPIEGIALEVAGTFVLAISALTASSRFTSPIRQGALVGGTLFILILFIGPLTGASFNPARSMGPSLFSGYFANQFIYYVGPPIGGLIAGLAFARRGKTHA